MGRESRFQEETRQSQGGPAQTTAGNPRGLLGMTTRIGGKHTSAAKVKCRRVELAGPAWSLTKTLSRHLPGVPRGRDRPQERGLHPSSRILAEDPASRSGGEGFTFPSRGPPGGKKPRSEKGHHPPGGTHSRTFPAPLRAALSKTRPRRLRSSPLGGEFIQAGGLRQGRCPQHGGETSVFGGRRVSRCLFQDVDAFEPIRPAGNTARSSAPPSSDGRTWPTIICMCHARKQTVPAFPSNAPRSPRWAGRGRYLAEVVEDGPPIGGRRPPHPPSLPTGGGGWLSPPTFCTQPPPDQA